MKSFFRLLLGNVFVLSIVFAGSLDVHAETVRGEVKHSSVGEQLFTLKSNDDTILLISWDKKTVVKKLASPAAIKADDFITVDYNNKDGQQIASKIAIPEIALPAGMAEAPLELLDRFANSSLSDQPLNLIDIRVTGKYDAGHIPGAISIPLPRIEKKTAALLFADKGTPLVFYDDGTETDGIVKAAQVTVMLGYKKVMVYKDGVRGWVRSGRFLASSPTFIRKHKPVLIDLRSADKVEQGHIEGAVNYALHVLDQKQDDFPADRRIPVVVYGENDKEALAGAAIIRKWGFRNVTFLPGGVTSWQNSAEALEIGPAAEWITSQQAGHSGQLQPDDFRMAMVSTLTVEIVDVRSEADYNKGKLPVGVHIPLQQIARRHGELSKDKIQVVFAAEAERAEMAYDFLKAKGYKVNYLNGTVQFDGNGEYQIK